jgi:hypothetical protein
VTEPARTITCRIDSRPPALWEAIGFTVERDADGNPAWLIREERNGDRTRITRVRWGAAVITLNVTGTAT